MTASVPFAIDVLSRKAALLGTPGADPETVLDARLGAMRVRCAMAEMPGEAYSSSDNWKRLGDLVEAILTPATAAQNNGEQP